MSKTLHISNRVRYDNSPILIPALISFSIVFTNSCGIGFIKYFRTPDT